MTTTTTINYTQETLNAAYDKARANYRLPTVHRDCAMSNCGVCRSDAEAVAYAMLPYLTEPQALTVTEYAVNLTPTETRQRIPQEELDAKHDEAIQVQTELNDREVNDKALTALGLEIVNVIHDRLVTGVALASQAIKRDWQSHYDYNMLPDVKWMTDYMTVRSDQTTQGNDQMHALGVLSTVLEHATFADDDSPVRTLAHDAVSRSIRLMIVDRTTSDLVADAVLGRLKDDDPRLKTISLNNWRLPSNTAQALDVRQAIEDKWRSAWDVFIERLDEHANDHEYCSEYEQNMEQLREMLKHKGMTEPNREMEVEVEGYAEYVVTVTRTITVSVPVSTTMQRGGDEYDTLYDHATYNVSDSEVSDSLADHPDWNSDFDVRDIELVSVN